MSFHYPTGSGGTGSVSITGTNSVTTTPSPITGTGTVQLVNDSATPGNSKYYGTDSGGTRGYFTLPVGGSIATNQIAFGSASNTISGANNFEWINSTKTFVIKDNSGNIYLQSVATSGITQIGDISGVGNSTVFKVDDSLHAASLTGDFNMSGFTITNLANPTNPQDAVTKFYADSLENGLKWKSLVDAATVTTLPANTYNNGASGIGATLTGNTNAALGSIDGYALTVGQRILVQNEANSSHNGIFDFTQNGNGTSQPYILTRSSDCNTSSQISMAATSVSNGTQAGFAFNQTTLNPVIGTDPIVWVRFLNTIYSAGAGLALTGQIFSLDVTHANSWTGAQTFGQTKFLLKDNTSDTISISAPNSTTTYALVMPAAQGSASTTLVNDGAGNLSWGTAGSGTVSSVSVVSANGFAGTVATSTTTPAITLSTTITGVLKGNGTAISAATVGSDYSVGTASLATGILKSTTGTGALSIAVAGTDYQAPGSYITALTGDGTASGPGSAAFTLATVNSNVGTFGDATHVGAFTVNGKGLITAASSIAITGITPGGSAGGDLTGTYPNPTIIPSVNLTANPTTTTQATTDNSTKIATTAYVTTAISNAIAAVNPAVAVLFATTSASDTAGYTYNNGVGGIGATLTGSNNVAFTADGQTATALLQRVLIKNDTQSPSGAYNGVYYVSQLQTAILPPILTRALDYDQPSDINSTGAVPVINGTVNTDTSWLLTSSITTVGTDPLTYVRFTINPSTIQTTTLTNTHIWVGNSSNIATDVAASGDLTLANTGAFTIANNAVTTAKINNAAVTYAKIQNVSNGALLGNDSGGAAAPSEITLANTLTFPTSTTLGIDLTHANTWTGTQTFNATAQVGVASSATGLLKFANSGGANIITMSAPSGASAYTFTLPSDGGTSGYVLQTNGSGTTSWVASGGGGSVSIDALTAATLNTITDAANFVFNGSNGTIQKITLGASRTFTISNLKVGIPYTFLVFQDGTGGRVLTWGTTSVVAYKGGGTPPISTAASAVDKYSMISDGTNIYVDYALSYT